MQDQTLLQITWIILFNSWVCVETIIPIRWIVPPTCSHRHPYTATYKNLDRLTCVNSIQDDQEMRRRMAPARSLQKSDFFVSMLLVGNHSTLEVPLRCRLHKLLPIRWACKGSPPTRNLHGHTLQL